jgi:SAM-dependent methyltransferase
VLAAALAGCGEPPAPAPAPDSLAALCERYPTDKCSWRHGYTEFYETLFAPLRNQPVRVLEIGVLNGMSMRLWEAYFPAGRIFGLDVEPKTEFDSTRVTTLVADQGKRADLHAALSRAGPGFDIVIDDGGHHMHHQQISFAVLFPALKPGGLYIIEDVHTSFPHLYKGYGVEADGANSTYAMIDGYARSGVLRSKYMGAEEAAYLNANIAYCAYYFRTNRQRSDLLLCRKK